MSKKTENNTPATVLLRKLSAKTIMKKIEAPAEGETIEAFKVVGIAHVKETGESSFGNYTRFKGDFAAVRADGTRFRSGVAFLPPAATDMLSAALEESDGGVEFGFVISLVGDENSTTNYVYEVQPLFESAPSDPLAAVAAKADVKLIGN